MVFYQIAFVLGSQVDPPVYGEFKLMPQCYHLNHVKTQIPYAVTVAAVAFVNYIIAGYLQNVIIDLIIAFASMFGVLVIIRMVEQKKQPAAVKN